MSDALQKPLAELPKFGGESDPTPELLELQPEQTENEPFASVESGEQAEPDAVLPVPVLATTATPTAARMPIAKDALTHQIEKILEDDLAEMYFQMPAETQVKFKTEGEHVTATIRQILKSGIVKMKKVLSLILDWLRIIPGVNRFFIEKEAKIKAEKILALSAQV